MYKVKCLNPIAKVGMDVFSDAYEKRNINRNNKVTYR